MKLVQDCNFEQQGLKSGLLEDHPSCAFARMLPDNPPDDFISTPFGYIPKGSVLSYDLNGSTKETSEEFPALPIGILDNTPCVFQVENVEQCTQLAKIDITLGEVHSLEQCTCEQSLSTKWQHCRVGRVTTSQFGDAVTTL